MVCMVPGRVDMHQDLRVISTIKDLIKTKKIQGVEIGGDPVLFFSK